MHRWLSAVCIFLGLCLSAVLLRPPSAWRALVLIDTETLAGRQPIGRSLIELGLEPDDFPATALFPPPPRVASRPVLQSNDPAIRLARVLREPRDVQWAELSALAASNPDSAPLQAALCRHAWVPIGPLRLGREWEIDPKARNRSRRPPVETADVDRLLVAADLGSRREPDNAFFPTMAAVACLAAHRDAEARAWLLRAATGTFWNEHLDYEVDGTVAEVRARGGDRTLGPLRAARQAAILYGYYSEFRQAARLWVSQADRSEATGDVATAMALRRTLHRIGATLRIHGPTLIANLVGSAVEGIARHASRPSSDDSVHHSRRPDTTPDRCLAWFERHKDATTVQRWRSTEPAAKAIRNIVESGIDIGPYAFSSSALAIAATAQRWAALASWIWLAIVATIAVLFGRIQSDPGRRWSFVIGTTLALATGAVLLRNAGGGLRDLIATAGLIEGLQSVDGNGVGQGNWLASMRRDIGATVLLAAVPIAVCMVSGAVALAGGQRFPRVLALAAAVASLLPAGAYLARLPADSHAEAETTIALNEVVTREGPYIASKLGVAWPDP
ncbi:MAG: hypothetical protein ACKO5K_13555 [Armatimonadota bacterium]